MQFDKILSYTDELLADLDALMRIESVDGENNEACQQALDFMLSRAKDFGLVPERVTDKSGQVDLGSGGKVCGVLRSGGNYHCYNVVGDVVFDLTSEQFGDEKLDYSEQTEQLREVHFAAEEKKARYEYLKAKLTEMLRQR